MALQTSCQTDGAHYHTRIRPGFISADVHFPGKLDLSVEDAQELERNLHNAIELVLKPYWSKIKPR